MASETLQHLKDDVATVEAIEFGDRKPDNAIAFVENTPEEKALLRKIDLYLMPSIWLLYLFSYMDRTNIGNAKVAGMERDLVLSNNDYSLAIILFQISYVLFGVPSNMLLSRLRPSRYISALMFLWGAVVACLAAIQTPAQLLGVRWLLGTIEAGFTPAVLFMISMWYRQREQSKRFLVFWTAAIFSGAFAGLLAGAIAEGLDGAHGIAGWRWLFLVEGVITCGLAFIAPLTLLDYPATSAKLTQEQRTLAVKRLEADGFRNDTGERRIGHRKALASVFLTPRIWLIFAAYMTVDGSFSISYFFPTVVEGLGYSSINAQYMTAPLYVVVIPVVIVLAFLADRKPVYRPVFLACTMLVGSFFSALIAGIMNYVARYAFLCFMNIAMWSANPLALSFASVTFGPVEPETRAIGLAAMNGFGNLALVYGGYLFPSTDAPRYLRGFATYAALLCVGAAMYLVTNMVFRKKPLRPSS